MLLQRHINRKRKGRMPKFKVEDGEQPDQVFSPFEKLYNLPMYLGRKTVLWTSKASLMFVSFLAEGFGFRFEYELEDKPEWQWLKDWSLPRYGVERKD